MFQSKSRLTNLVSHSRALSDLLMDSWNIFHRPKGEPQKTFGEPRQQDQKFGGTDL